MLLCDVFLLFLALKAYLSSEFTVKNLRHGVVRDSKSKCKKSLKRSLNFNDYGPKSMRYKMYMYINCLNCHKRFVSILHIQAWKCLL